MYINSKMLKIATYLLASFLAIFPAIAEVINNIDVIGNKRVSKETIINFSDLKIGDDVTNDTLNQSLKELYNSSFFVLFV